MSVILVTGADGFVGSRLSLLLEQCGYQVRRAVRAAGKLQLAKPIVVGDLATFSEWPDILQDVDAVVHLAARAHVMADKGLGSDSRYRVVNVDATVRLAAAAARQQVRRFVFVSSIGVNGEQTSGRAFTEEDEPAPSDTYAASKWQAEQALSRIQSETGLQLAVVRPSLVYGPGVKGNLLRLLKLVKRGLPLPLGGLRRPRSFVGLYNLCELIIACIEHSGAAGNVFLAAEPQRRSTGELLEAISTAMGQRHRIWHCPLSVLNFVAFTVGKRADLQKLQWALEVDPSRAMRVLGWQPRVSFEDGIQEMVSWFLRVEQ